LVRCVLLITLIGSDRTCITVGPSSISTTILKKNRIPTTSGRLPPRKFHGFRSRKTGGHRLRGCREKSRPDSVPSAIALIGAGASWTESRRRTVPPALAAKFAAARRATWWSRAVHAATTDELGASVWPGGGRPTRHRGGRGAQGPAPRRPPLIACAAAPAPHYSAGVPDCL
jgi:hypothetical protein